MLGCSCGPFEPPGAVRTPPLAHRFHDTRAPMDLDPGEHLWPDEEAHTARIVELIESALIRRYSKGTTRRDAHPKAHGGVRAIFQVEKNLAHPFAQGAFVAGREYKAWVRFSNGNGNPRRPDIVGDARGMALKLC